MRVMGVDPGLQITGWGVVENNRSGPKVVEAGIIRTVGNAPLGVRLHELYEGVREVIEAHRPAVMAVEELFSHYRHPTTAILMGHARGVIILAAADGSIPVVTYSATRIKKCITGNGRADKQQLQRMITAALKLDCVPEPPDVTDALAAALTHFSDYPRRFG